MKRKPSFSEHRQIRRMRRSTKCTILEMFAETMAYRAALADYQQWTTTDSYRQAVDQLRETLTKIQKQFGEDIDFME